MKIDMRIMRGASCIRCHRKYQQGWGWGGGGVSVDIGINGNTGEKKKKKRQHLKIPPLTSEDGPYTEIIIKI